MIGEVAEAIKAKLADERLLGSRYVIVTPAPFRHWHLTVFTKDRTNCVQIDLEASELQGRVKFLAKKLEPSLEKLNAMEGNEAA